MSDTVHFDAECPTKLDFSYHEQLAYIRNFIYVICAFNLLALYMAVLEPSVWPVWATPLLQAIWCVFIVFALTYRKPYAAFHLKFLVIYEALAAILKLVVLCMAPTAIPFIFEGVWLVVIGVVFYKVFTAEDMKVVFPAEFTSTRFVDVVIAATVSVLPWLLFLGYYVYQFASFYINAH